MRRSRATTAAASDQIAGPQTTGNVLPNDGDIDANDSLVVVGVRTAPKRVQARFA